MNLDKMQKHLPDLFDYFPKTWLLPNDRNLLISELKKNDMHVVKKRHQIYSRDNESPTKRKILPLGKF